jgi:hypothetical protein
MITLLSTLDLERYTPRTYVYCNGDSMSITNIVAFESAATPPVTSQKVSVDRQRTALTNVQAAIHIACTSASSESGTTSVIIGYLKSPHSLCSFQGHPAQANPDQRQGAMGRFAPHQRPWDSIGYRRCLLGCKGMFPFNESILMSPDLGIAVAHYHLRRVLCARQIAQPVGETAASLCRSLRRAVA